MRYDQRKIVKKFQIALRRTVLGKKLAGKHSIHKYQDTSKLINRMEKLFFPEMTWENFGSVWEFAHVIPVNQFDHTKEEHLKLCWSHKNVIPMLKEDNKNFGACLLFSKAWFEANKDEDYSEHLKFVNDRLSIYYKYM